MQYYLDEHTAGLFTVPAEWDQSYSSTPFVNENVYMTIGSTAGMDYNVPTNGSIDIGCAPIPQKDADHKAVIQQGTNISIMSNSTSQQQLAAWLLTKYLTSTAATIQWAEQTGYLPVRLSALDDAGYQTFLDTPTAAQKYVAMAEKAAFEEVDYMYYDPAFVGSSNARDEMNLLVGNILFGGQTPADALSDALWDLQG